MDDVIHWPPLGGRVVEWLITNRYYQVAFIGRDQFAIVYVRREKHALSLIVTVSGMLPRSCPHLPSGLSSDVLRLRFITIHKELLSLDMYFLTVLNLDDI